MFLKKILIILAPLVTATSADTPIAADKIHLEASTSSTPEQTTIWRTIDSIVGGFVGIYLPIAAHAHNMDCQSGLI